MRVLHAVQQQQQRAAFGGFDQRLQLVLVPGLGGGVTRDHTLVAQAADDAGERLLGDPAHIDIEAPRQGFDFGQPRILRASLDQHFTHMLGIVLKRGDHRVDACDPLFLTHAALVRVWGGLYGPQRTRKTQRKKG